MLPGLIRRGREPSVGITVSEATITLRITAGGSDENEILAVMAPTVETIRNSLSTLVFGEGEEELEDVVARMLYERGKTVAVVEWATGGLVSQWLARTPQASSILAGGVVLTSLPQLQYVLGTLDVGLAMANEPRVASEAAEAARQRCGADYGLGIGAFPTEVDGPDAYVYISVATPERTRNLRFPTATHPDIRKSLTAKRALNAMRLILLGEDVPDSSS